MGKQYINDGLSCHLCEILSHSTTTVWIQLVHPSTQNILRNVDTGFELDFKPTFHPMILKLQLDLPSTALHFFFLARNGRPLRYIRRALRVRLSSVETGCIGIL